MSENMKRFILYAVSALTMMHLASCSLNEMVYTQPDETYITDASMLEAVLLNVYRDLGTDGIYRQYLPFVFDLPNDINKTEGNSIVSWRAEASNAFGVQDAYVQTTWQALYAAVYDANYFIELADDKIASLDDDGRRQAELFVAEARALRALLYFELVRWFGNVPLVTSTADANLAPEKYRQAAPEDVYAFIEVELKKAVDVLPWADADDVRTNKSFRLSKGSALGLLAKVYCTWAGYPLRNESKWEAAVQAAGEVVDSGHHDLLPDFRQLWVNSGSNVWDPKESLLELSYWSPLSTYESSGRVGNTNGVRCSAGGLRNGTHIHNVLVYFNPTFLASWRDYDKDRRFELTYADYQYIPGIGARKYALKTVDGVKNTEVSFVKAWTDTLNASWDESWRVEYNYRLTNRKWDTEVYVPDDNYQVNSNYTNMNWYLLRYADILLLYAEALNEVNGGPMAAAYAAVNRVRRRAFGQDMDTVSPEADLPAGLSQEEFRKAIMEERSYELAGEGHRRQDLIRWGRYYETVMETYQKLSSWHYRASEYYIGALYTQKGKHELLPIPQREADLCGFKQNPNWY